MNQVFCDWAADRLLKDLRRGDLPDGLSAGDLVWDPMLVALRRAVTPADEALIQGLLAQPETWMFGGLLSRGLPQSTGITEALTKAFRSELDPERKLGLFHQLAARSAGPDVCAALVDWVAADPRALIEEQRRYFAGPDAEARLMERMSNPQFADKRWVYLYSAHALDDPIKIKAFIQPFLADRNPLLARAAASSLNQLSC